MHFSEKRSAALESLAHRPLSPPDHDWATIHLEKAGISTMFSPHSPEESSSFQMSFNIGIETFLKKTLC